MSNADIEYDDTARQHDAGRVHEQYPQVASHMNVVVVSAERGRCIRALWNQRDRKARGGR